VAAERNSAGLSVTKIRIRYLAYGLLLVLLVGIVASRFWMRHDLIPDAGAVTERIQPVADLEIAPPPNATAERGKRTGVFLVHGYCRSCHSSGQGGAPQIGDRKAWAPRMNQGLDALVQSVVSGKCSIPPGSSDAVEMELARAVVYMIWPRMSL